MGWFDLTDGEWAIIAPQFPKSERGATRKDDRQILNGIFYILQTGAPWRPLPERCGPRAQRCTTYRYSRWGKRGIWKGIFDALARERKGSLIFIDSSIRPQH